MRSNELTDAQCWEILEVYKRCGENVYVACAELGLPRGTFRHRLTKAQLRFGDDMTRRPKPQEYEKIAPEPLHVVQRLKYEKQIETLTARVKELEEHVTDSITFQELREKIYGLANTPTKPPKWKTTPRTGNGFSGIPIAVLSDLHYGEVVSLNQMGGTNQYNIEIAEQRIKDWCDSLIDLCFKHETWQGGYPGIVLCLGGDMISGDIHKELAETNALPTLASTLRLAGVLEAAIKQLADKFGAVMVPCVVGNHGRMTHKPQAKDYNELNYETLLYLQLEQAFKDDKRVQFIFPNDTLVHFSVYGFNYALTHGNLLGVKGGDGIIGPIGPITRGVHKLISSEASKPNPTRIDYVIMGHWHTAMRTRNIFVNGSLKGFDEYARTFLRTSFERPAQIMWFTHPEHGAVKFQAVYSDADMAPYREKRLKQEWFSSPQQQQGHWKHARPK